MGEGVLYNFVFTEFPFKTVSDDVTAFHKIANISQYCWGKPIPVMVAGNLATGNLATNLVTLSDC